MEPCLLPFTAYPSKRRLLLSLLGSVVFSAIGVLLICDGKKDDAAAGWLCGIFFGLGSVIILAELHPKASFLTVDKDGIEFCSLFRKTRLRWAEISGFGAFKYFRWYRFETKKVGINFSVEYKGSSKGRAVAKTLIGFEGQLPDAYGFRAEDLAQLLTHFHQEAMHKNDA